MTVHIHIIGSVGKETTFTTQHIETLLNREKTELRHGKTFTGRPSTNVHIDEHNVLKIHSDISLKLNEAKKWAQYALAKEQKYAVYHPQKTWFVAAKPGQEIAEIGNICPRLQPLHELLAQTDENNPTPSLGWLEQLFILYFRVAVEHKVRLDEGLSNFAINEQGKVFYVDDDVYTWDKFISCAHILGGYFRSLAWLSAPDTTLQLANIVRQQILLYFKDKHCLYVLAEQLRDVFTPVAVQQKALVSFSEVLHQDIPEQPQHHQPPRNNTRYVALLSDIHANLPALEAVLTYLKQNDIQQGFILGDIVGYGPHPSECIERLEASHFSIIKGNHDHGLATDNFSKGFSVAAKWVLDWSRTRVSEVDKQWLADLPPVLHGDNWLAVHGAPIDPTFFNAYVYTMTYEENLNVLQKKQIPLCFHGHTHQQGAYTRNRVLDSHVVGDNNEINLNEFEYALICPGSVGQPRNNKPGAQFAIWDTEDKKLIFKTINYDMQGILQFMQQEGFPAQLMYMLTGERPE